jgi:hypothetical protein
MVGKGIYVVGTFSASTLLMQRNFISSNSITILTPFARRIGGTRGSPFAVFQGAPLSTPPSTTCVINYDIFWRWPTLLFPRQATANTALRSI